MTEVGTNGSGSVPVSLEMKVAGLAGLFGSNIPVDDAFISGGSVRPHNEAYCMGETDEADLGDVPKLTRSRSRPQNVGDLVIPAQKLDDPSDGPEVRDADNFEGERGPRR